MTPRATPANSVRPAARLTAAPPDSVGVRARGTAYRFLTEEDGATMVEYGMMVALIAIVVMGALYMLGGTLALKLNQVASCLTTRSC